MTTNTRTTAFSDAELRFLRGERLLGRVATVGKDGTPHVAPVGWSYTAEEATSDIGDVHDLQDVREAGPRGDPHVPQSLGRTRIVEVFEGLAANVGQRALDRADDVGDRDGFGRHRQPIAADRPPLAGDDSGSAQ